MTVGRNQPLYQDRHDGCSILCARFRCEGALLSLPASDQFRWLHRFYLLLDAVAEKHQVYKLYAGAQGFMLSTAVAEPDQDHASTLLRFALHLRHAIEPICMPGQVPLKLVMVLASGPTSSGLLGSTSLTYQVVGPPVSMARELAESQMSLPFIVTASTHKELSSSAAALLEPVGSQPLGCLRGEAQQLFTLPQFRGLPITPPAGPAAGRAAEAEPQQPAAPMQHDLRTFNSDSSDSSDSYVANALEMLQLP